MKFNTQERTIDGVKFVFVTRRRANKFSELEIQEYLVEATGKSPEVPEVAPEVFGIKDEQRSMFMKDLRFGLKFCCDKYGVTEDEIVDEAKRIAPHMNRLGK